ncbi:294_t:CDS:1 [Paraglomus occultum]|uniref:294_t:CDS:1 n=1 Tax=Paraglomus occultum TaxID=144539 RepID=A0A9N9FWE8_9GLOM|nr:294_t:CDS:1 [Paraglomus occultum]
MLTPLSKLRANIPSSLSSASRLIVLLTTGSFNPVHTYHIHNLELAKSTLEKSSPNNIVIGGFLSPSQDLYVRSKLGRFAIEADHRITMCQLATMHSNWIDVCKWEAKANEDYFVDFAYVVGRMQEFLQDQINRKVFVYYVCGSDHAIKTGVCGCDGGLVIIGRAVGDGDKQRQKCERILDMVYGRGVWNEFTVYIDGDGGNVSSTFIRMQLRDGKSEWEEYCDSNVVEYIKTHRLLMTGSD